MTLPKVALSLPLLAASVYAAPYVNLTYVLGPPQVLYNGYTVMQITKQQAQTYCNTGAPAFSVVDATIDDVHSAMMDGSLTCSQLVESYLQRMSAYDPQINAIREVNPDIMAEAASMDAMLPAYQSGAEEMPLLFLGLATANGAVALLDNMPPQDATEVMQVKKYGALVLAKGNMAEWAFSNAISIGSGKLACAVFLPLEAFGVVRNPYDLDRSTAGSSGGPAAAASAKFGMISLGSDTGNSIRGPSGHNGLGKQMGISRSYVNIATNDQEIVRLFNQAVADLEAGGAEIVDNFTITGNSLGDQNWSGYIPVTATASNGSIVNTGAYGYNNGSWYVGFGAEGHWEPASANACPNFREDLEAYLSTSGSHYRTLQQIYVDGLFHPTVTSSMAPPLYQNNFSTSAILQQPASIKANLTCTCGQFYDNPCRVEMRTRLIESMDAEGIDAFIYPGWGYPPRLIGDLSETGASPLGDFSQGLLPATGVPGMVVQMGLHANLSTSTALQIGARPFDEATLFEIGYAYEQLVSHVL
eukprot:jgi/Astpho2/7381/Aster-01970